MIFPVRFLLLGLLLCHDCLRAADDYQLGPDSKIQEGVPQGAITRHKWVSKIFAGTERDYWVYVPKQYDAAKPAAVMVFQDGGGYVMSNGQYRVPVVFDNLIHKKEMPVTIGIFINPGILPALQTNQLPRYNRSYEYDTPNDQYARFLVEEILPEVAKNYNLSTNPAARGIGGASSGAICAFNAAWERPDQFSKVFSTIGTYVNLRNAHNLPGLVRKTEPKAIRVFLQDGTNDLNIYGGNWWVANQDLASALEFAGYDLKTAWGDGGHNGKHGGSIFPDAMRWLWRDEAIKPGEKSKQPVVQLLQPGEGWQLVGEGYRFTEGPAVNATGEVFFTDIPNNLIHKIALDGSVSVFVENSGSANGLMFGPNGKLYACQNGKKQIVAYDAAGKEEVVATEVQSNDLVVNHRGEIYFTDPANKQVWFVNARGEKRVVDKGIGRPNGIILTPDQGTLVVADSSGPHLWAFRIESDGSLSHKQPYYTMHLLEGRGESGADGMTVDVQGRIYVTTAMGLQFFDQAGRVNGIISKPQPKSLSNAVFGGPELDTLFVTCADKVFKRKTRTKGVAFFKGPYLPAAPRL